MAAKAHSKKAAKHRMDVAAKSLREMMKEIEPFTKRPVVQFVDSRGTWEPSNTRPAKIEETQFLTCGEC
jgi:hypothetical protein